MKKLSALIYVASMAFVLSGCVLTATGSHHPREQAKAKPHRQGPPPHAPAHGYRYKHAHGVVLSFDTGIGAYVVIGYPGVYFYNGHYLRQHVRGNWLSSSHYSGPWRNSSARDVPAKLERKMRKGQRPRDHRENRERRDNGH